MANRRIPIAIGQVFGRLVVIESVGEYKGSRSWLCMCSCGGSRVTVSSSLKSGRTVSCGCAQREAVKKTNMASRTHGRGRHGVGIKGDRTYRSWSSMCSRCSNPNDPSFYDYGGRGISVTKPWRDSFESFLNDMGERPPDTSIDRIDNRFGYFAANCRWSDKYQQARNRRKANRMRFPTATMELARRDSERTNA